MKNEKLKKLTLEELINRKMQSGAEKYKMFTIEIPEIGGSLAFEKKNIHTFLRYIEEIDAEKVTASEVYEFMRRIIYEHSPIMHSEKLQKAYNCAEPYDIVDEIFFNNIGAVVRCGEKVIQEYGVNLDDIKEKIKK